VTDRSSRPNVVLVLADDMGFSDIGCYGGEISTPHLDRLAAAGVRMAQFYNTARCSPSRASLLTGLHPHQTGVGVLTYADLTDGYPGVLNDRCVTIAEVLGTAGYTTWMSGKWHLTGSRDEPDDAWPTRRGFQRFFGTIDGAANYFNPTSLHRDETPVPEDELATDFYYTDAIADAAVEFIADRDDDRPFFGYVAFTAPHWPLHARDEDVAALAGRYAAGWDELRSARHRRLVDQGILDPSWVPNDRDPEVPAWDDVEHPGWEARRMEVYAAQVEAMDRGIGRVVAALEEAGELDDTILLFLSDNGGCAEGQGAGYMDEVTHRIASMRVRTRAGERIYRGNVPEVIPGPETTYGSYGRAWANLSNTPFREYKHWVHEGGISTPLVVHWPAGITAGGAVRQQPFQLPDVLATLLDATGVDYPDTYPGRDLLPPEGRSMLDAWRDDRADPEHPEHTLYWEHEGNAALRRGRWKLVRKYPGDWELYDIGADRTETHDLAAANPDVVGELAGEYRAWADRCGVLPREQAVAGGRA
jgi:arylsulfatase